MGASVSVLMPVYNGAAFLERSIGSIVRQTLGSWELIALDDGSSDGSLEMLRRMAEADNRIKVMTKENDGRGNTALNLSLMYGKAVGEWFFYMSQDDEIAPDCLQSLLRRAGETGAEAVIPDMLLKHSDGTTTTWPCSYPPHGDHSRILSGREAFYLSTDFSINGFALIHNRLMRDSRCDTQSFDSDELNTRLQFLWASRVAFADTTFYYYRGNPDAITVRFHPRQFQRLRTALLLKEAFEREFADHHHRIRLMRQLMWVYVNSVFFLFNHRHEMSDADIAVAEGLFLRFEKAVSFAGYRLDVLRQQNSWERTFALCYFFLGSCRPAERVYRLIHRLRGKR